MNDVCVIGSFRAESGLGESARLTYQALDAAGIDVVALDEPHVANRQAVDFPARYVRAPVGRANLFSLSPTMLMDWVSRHGPRSLLGRYNIGAFHWEVDALPASWHGVFDLIDEVWAGSRHAAKAFRPHHAHVHVFPLPIVAPEQAPQGPAPPGWPGGTVVLTLFDFLANSERKNPHGAIEAFQAAFPRPGDAHLLVKTQNGRLRPRELQHLRAVASRPDIHVVDAHWSRAEVTWAMQQACALLSLHRAEGFGLSMGEAMAMGTPVVATAYSGNLDFMTSETSWLVPAEEVRLRRASPPYPAGAHWGEPDLEHAAHAIRAVVQGSADLARAERGRSHILGTHGVDARRPFLQERVAAAVAAVEDGRALASTRDGFHETCRRLRSWRRRALVRAGDAKRTAYRLRQERT